MTTNTASISSETFDPNPENNSSSVTVVVTSTPPIVTDVNTKVSNTALYDLLSARNKLYR